MTSAAPARGTRPRNRKELILTAARALFYERGYPHVSVGDIADAVGVGPSALYRHYRGKGQLLAAVLVESSAAAADAARAATQAADPVLALAADAAERRELGVLWEREGRHLDADARAALNEHVQDYMASLRRIVAARRPGLGEDDETLLAWFAAAVLVSPSFHRTRLPEGRLETLLADLVRAAVDAPVHAEARVGGGPVAPVAHSRREELLGHAVNLFAERGFVDVTIEDIAARLGLTGNSIYRHFPNKTEILLAAMIRGAEWLRLDLTRARSDSAGPEQALGALVTSYVGLTTGHPDLISTLLTETGHLPPAVRDRIEREQRDYVEAWLSLMELVHPDEGRDVARFRVQAVLTLANLTSRKSRLQGRPDLAAVVEGAGVALLGLASGRSA